MAAKVLHTLRQALYLTFALAIVALMVLSVHERMTPPYLKRASIPVASN
jgi:hypothetical protein